MSWIVRRSERSSTGPRPNHDRLQTGRTTRVQSIPSDNMTILRQVYIETERDRIERETKHRIERLQIKIGVQNLEYEERYEAIMQDYRLRVQALMSLSK